MCVTKIHHVVILHMLKIYRSKTQGKFKFKSGKSGKSQGIFAPDMAGNPVSRFASFCMNIWSREYSEFLICLAPKIFVFILGPEEKTERFNLEHSWGYCRLQVFAMLFLCFFK